MAVHAAAQQRNQGGRRAPFGAGSRPAARAAGPPTHPVPPRRAPHDGLRQDLSGVPARAGSAPSDRTGIPAALRARMEHALGADFSDVRVRTDSARAAGLGAHAFTRGSAIDVAPGHWAPRTRVGQELLGHELAHVLQQRAGRVASTARLAAARLNDDPALEREADALGARAALAGSPPATAARTPLGPLAAAYGDVIQRQPRRAGGSPADRVIHEMDTPPGAGNYRQAFRILSGLTLARLMSTLTDVEGRGRLDELIANAAEARAPLNQTRLVTAMQVVRQSHGAAMDLRAAEATIAASALPASDKSAMNAYLVPLRPPVPTTSAADQRAAIPPGGPAAIPDAGLATELGYELDPSSRPAPAAAGAPPPARTPWDGRTGAPTEVAARAQMQAQMFTAFDAYLTAFRPRVLAVLTRTQPSVDFTAAPAAAGAAAGAPPPTGVVDIANQARGELERRYAASMDAATATPAQLTARAPMQGSGAGQNIFDPYREADRTALTGSANLANGVAWWLFDNDAPGAAAPAGSRTFATQIKAAHNYSTQDPGAEQFRWSVANAYAAASTLAPNNRRQLIDYRLTGWNEAGPTGFTLLSSFEPGADRNRSELVQRWAIFKSAMHESLHLRAHPRFVAADQGRGTMHEGFVEMFAFATLNTDVLPRARAGSIETLRRTVEGAQSPATPDPTIITDSRTPTQYVAHRQQAERIRDGGTPPGGAAHVGVGEAAVRAAFFEGHVEYLGLAPAGAQLTTLPAAGATALVRIPGGITGLADLARRSGVPRATIVADNPGITSPLPASAVLTGCREHWAVAGETRANVAAQNGVSEADLVRANPDVPLDAVNAWPALTAGQKILIPVH
jgi:hypothetical protein